MLLIFNLTSKSAFFFLLFVLHFFESVAAQEERASFVGCMFEGLGEGEKATVLFIALDVCVSRLEQAPGKGRAVEGFLRGE